jgi:hypothetical protein
MPRLLLLWQPLPLSEQSRAAVPPLPASQLPVFLLLSWRFCGYQPQVTRRTVVGLSLARSVSVQARARLATGVFLFLGVLAIETQNFRPSLSCCATDKKSKPLPASCSKKELSEATSRCGLRLDYRHARDVSRRPKLNDAACSGQRQRPLNRMWKRSVVFRHLSS